MLPNPIAGWIAGWIAARLATTDAQARAHGWTVTRRRFSGRTYHDPRFDQLANRTTAHTVERADAIRGVGR